MRRDEEDVLEANARFYRAFAARDAESMDALWAKTLPVACIHPGWSALRGRAHVIASFRGLFGGDTLPALRFSEPSVHLLGEVAIVICYEHFAIPDVGPEGARLLATNVFAREDGEWRMVHHQAGPASQRSDPEPTPKSRRELN